jgi:hypothetical protein
VCSTPPFSVPFSVRLSFSYSSSASHSFLDDVALVVEEPGHRQGGGHGSMTLDPDEEEEFRLE